MRTANTARRRVLLAFAGLVAATVPAPPAGAAEQPRNGLIAFSAARAGDRVLYTRGPDGRGLKLLATGGRSDHPAFSPRGRRLAFTKYGPLGAQIFVSYLDGTGYRQLTSGPSDTMAAWSPSGAELIFVRSVLGQRDLYRIGADGTGLIMLTSSRRNDELPSWSITDQVAFVRRSGGSQDIYAMSARGGAARRLTRSRQPDLAPAWSPTGKTVVFTRGRPGRRDLYVIRADGRGARRLTRVAGDETDATWSPDGSRIAFTHTRNGARRLYLMKAKGKPVDRLVARSLRVRRLTSGRAAARAPSWQPTGLAPVVAAAGDIACDPASPYFNGGLGVPGLCRQKLTSDLLLRSDLSSILVPGDLQYEDGKLAAFQASFDPTWGRLKPLIRPVPGNHEYHDRDAAGYFDYFNGPGVRSGQAGDRATGYYSFNVGDWHVIALNSECESVGGCEEGSPQVRWLRADLAANPRACTLAFFHGPRFTSGRYGEQAERVRPFWTALYEANADLVLSGHEHFYERFGPQTPDGVADPARGIRQLTVGMGGKSRHGFVAIAPNSEMRDNGTLGVAELTLHPGAYDWRLVRAPTGGVADSGSGRCH
ncbi:MAG: metallophosphoesterase [Actinomycetota bacterium]|nr:metallophosphoesterase [Actinomycetota bacterium]